MRPSLLATPLILWKVPAGTMADIENAVQGAVGGELFASKERIDSCTSASSGVPAPPRPWEFPP